MRRLACLGFAIVATGCFGGAFGGDDDDRPQCTYTRAVNPKDVIVDAQTLCASEEDGSLSIGWKPTNASGLHTMDLPNPSAANSDPGFAPDRCRVLCGDPAYTRCFFVGEYDAFLAAKDVPGCGWAKPKTEAKLTCWTVESYRTTCSQAVG